MSGSVSKRVILKAIPGTGREAVAELDTDQEDDPIVIGSVGEWQRRHIRLAPSASDTAFTFSNAVALEFFANRKFHLRLGSAQAQLTNIRSFGWSADDVTVAVHATSVLLSNPSSTDPVEIDVLFVERVG